MNDQSDDQTFVWQDSLLQFDPEVWDRFDLNLDLMGQEWALDDGGRIPQTFGLDTLNAIDQLEPNRDESDHSIQKHQSDASDAQHKRGHASHRAAEQPNSCGMNLTATPEEESSAPHESSRTVLKEWARRNVMILYPSSATKKLLANRSGLSLKQVTTWFSNYRQRVIKPLYKTSLPGSHKLNINTATRCSGEELSRSIATTDRQAGPGMGHMYPSDKVSASSTLRKASTISTFYSCPDLRKRQSQYSNSFYQKWNGEIAILKHTLIEAWIESLPQDNTYDHAFRADGPLNGFVISAQKDSTQCRSPVSGPPCTYRYGPNLRRASKASRRYSRSSNSSRSSKRQASPDDMNVSSKARRTGTAWSDRSFDRADSVSDTASVTPSYASSSQSYFSHESRRGRKMPSLDIEKSQQLDGELTERCSEALEQAKIGPTEESLGTTFKERRHCNLCNQIFIRQSTLKRHLESVHIKAERYICRPLSSPNAWPPLCLCGNPEGRCNHKMHECWIKSQELRTFYRVDNFRLHLQRTHRLGSMVAGLSMKHFRI